MSVPPVAGADPGNPKQRRDSVALEAMGLAGGNTWRQRQYRLRPIQGLDLARLVHTQHMARSGGFNVQTDNIRETGVCQWAYPAENGALVLVCARDVPGRLAKPVRGSRRMADASRFARNRRRPRYALRPGKPRT